MQFFKAYAAIRHLIMSPSWADRPIADLRLACDVVEYQLAQQFDITATSLIGALVEVGRLIEEIKDGQDQGGSPRG